MKDFTIILTATVAAMVCLGAGSVMAADDCMKQSAADFNKGGMVTEDELVTFVRMNFMIMDKNNDHMVEVAEWDDSWFLDQ